MTRKYFIIAMLGIVIWFTETAIFGFHDKPQSGLEAALDVLSGMLIAWGIVGSLLIDFGDALWFEKHHNYIYEVKTGKMTVNDLRDGKNPKTEFSGQTTVNNKNTH